MTDSVDALPAGWLTYHEGAGVQLHSGGWTDCLVHGDVLFAHEPTRERVLDCWMRAFTAGNLREYGYWGIPDGGTPWAKAFAERVGGHWCETKPKGYHPPIILIDDVTTTGASLLSCPPWGGISLVVVRRDPAVEVSAAWLTIDLPTL